jgi:hypothetical protein
MLVGEVEKGRGARRNIVEVFVEQETEEVKKDHVQESTATEALEVDEFEFDDVQEKHIDQEKRKVLVEIIVDEESLKPVLINKHLAKLHISILRKNSVFSVTDDEATTSTPLPEEAMACSFELPSFNVARKEEVEHRVSRSEDVDVRTLVAGKTFSFCVCNMVSSLILCIDLSC